jgi:hypothetical protein
MRRIYRLKTPVRVIAEQSRPILWFPLIGMTQPGFIFLFSILMVTLLATFIAITPIC